MQCLAAGVRIFSLNDLAALFKWYPFSGNESMLVMNGPAMFSRRQTLAVTLAVRMLQVWILDVDVPSTNNAPSGCRCNEWIFECSRLDIGVPGANNAPPGGMPSAVNGSSNAAEWYACVKPNSLWSEYILLRDDSATSVWMHAKA